MTEYSRGTNDTADSGSGGAERSWTYVMAKYVCVSLVFWRMPHTRSNVHTRCSAPQQSNGYDCGIFVCCYAECLSAGQDFDFSQKEMDDIRVCIALELLCGKCFVK
jgi:Ulp1 family protease